MDYTGPNEADISSKVHDSTRASSDSGSTVSSSPSTQRSYSRPDPRKTPGRYSPSGPPTVPPKVSFASPSNRDKTPGAWYPPSVNHAAHPTDPSYPSHSSYPTNPSDHPSNPSYPHRPPWIPPAPPSYSAPPVLLPDSYNPQQRRAASPSSVSSAEDTQRTPPQAPGIAPVYHGYQSPNSSQTNQFTADAFDEKRKQVNFSIKVQPHLSGNEDEGDIFRQFNTAYTLPAFNNAEKTITPEIYDVVQTRLASKSDNRNHDIATLTFADETSLSHPETRWM